MTISDPEFEACLRSAFSELELLPMTEEFVEPEVSGTLEIFADPVMLKPLIVTLSALTWNTLEFISLAFISTFSGFSNSELIFIPETLTTMFSLYSPAFRITISPDVELFTAAWIEFPGST